MNRIYHPYWLWEEVEANMWGTVSDRKLYLQRAADFTGDHLKYGRFMLRVVNEWRYSCENALTDLNLNRRAWVGHAACALAIGCPEDITREAWGMLTVQQQDRANAQADHAIKEWERKHAEGSGIREPLGEQVLPGRNTRRGARTSGIVRQSAELQNDLPLHYEK